MQNYYFFWNCVSNYRFFLIFFCEERDFSVFEPKKCKNGLSKAFQSMTFDNNAAVCFFCMLIFEYKKTWLITQSGFTFVINYVCLLLSNYCSVSNAVSSNWVNYNFFNNYCWIFCNCSFFCSFRTARCENSCNSKEQKYFFHFV